MPEHCSLSHEFAHLIHAIRGAEELCEELTHDEMSPARKVDLARSVSAVIGLVESRLELLIRVIHQELDPAHFLAPWNRIPGTKMEHEDPDLILEPWSLEEQIDYAQSTLERLHRRL